MTVNQQKGTVAKIFLIRYPSVFQPIYILFNVNTAAIVMQASTLLALCGYVLKSSILPLKCKGASPNIFNALPPKTTIENAVKCFNLLLKKV